MFGLSFPHLILLAVLALIFIGPKQLPEVARVLARLLNDWKRATNDIGQQFQNMANQPSQHEYEKTIHPPAEQPPAPEIKTDGDSGNKT